MLASENNNKGVFEKRYLMIRYLFLSDENKKLSLKTSLTFQLDRDKIGENW